LPTLLELYGGAFGLLLEVNDMIWASKIFEAIKGDVTAGRHGQHVALCRVIERRRYIPHRELNGPLSGGPGHSLSNFWRVKEIA
jgi:hypothetical protein